MKNIKLLRRLNREVKYKPITKYIGQKVPLKIVNSEDIVSEIREFVSEFLNIKIGKVLNDNILIPIAKYGLIDISFEIEEQVEYDQMNGLQVLKESGWFDQEVPEESQKEGIEVLKIFFDESKANKNYLKIFALTTSSRGTWMKDKSYLVKQVLRGDKITPSVEDEIQTFQIKDMCMTNCDSIWTWKYFYT